MHDCTYRFSHSAFSKKCEIRLQLFFVFPTIHKMRKTSRAAVVFLITFAIIVFPVRPSVCLSVLDFFVGRIMNGFL